MTKQTAAQINDVDISSMMSESAEEYALDVILERAIPDLRDGLKPIHRRILWQHHLSKLTPTAKPTSVATVVGQTMKWHPHGDGSIESSLTGMSRDWIMNIPLIEIVGQGGTFDAGAAAGRYIKTRMTKPAELLTRGLSQDAVDFEPNYDGTDELPVVMPSAIPSAISLGTTGIAWGMRTSILPHNVIEALNVALLLLDKPDATTDEILKIMPGPDFPVGCTIIGKDSGRDEIETGEATYTIRGAIREITDDATRKGQRILEVYQLPPGVGSESFTASANTALSPVMRHFKIDSLDNETRESNPSVQITFDKAASDEDIEQVKALLFKKTNLQINLTAQNRMIHDGWARVMSMPEYIRAWLDFRRETLLRIRRFELASYQRDLEIINAALFIIDHAHEVTEVASESRSQSDMAATLQDRFDLTERQSEYISKQPLHRLSAKNTEWIQTQKTKKPDVEGNISRITEILGSEDKIRDMLRDDLQHTISELGEDKHARRTRIVDKSDVKDKTVSLSTHDLVESKPVTVVIRDDLTALRIGDRAFENQEPKAERVIVDHVSANTDEYVMLFTKHGRAVTRLVNDLTHVNLDDDVEPLNREIDSLQSDDSFVSAVPIRDGMRVLLVTKHGFGKTMSLDKIAPSTKTRAYVKRTIVTSGLKSDGDEVIAVIPFTSDETALSGSNIEYTVNTGKRVHDASESLEKWLKRDDSGGSSGAQLLKLKSGEYEASNIRITKSGKELLTISAHA